MTGDQARFLNALGLLGCCAILLVAFGYQFALGELPCPLCLLQRAAFCAVGLGLVLNVCHGPRPSHYGLIVLGAVAGLFIAGRQFALHLVPGTGAYGSALFGLHFYTWSAIAFAGIVVSAAIACLFERQFADSPGVSIERPNLLGRASLLLFLAVMLANAGATLAECGGGLCPDDPKRYEFLDSVLGAR